jgi:hypothetical protein
MGENMKVTKIEKVIAGIILTLLVVMGTSTYFLVSAVNEHGVKAILEEVWEGPEK